VVCISDRPDEFYEGAYDNKVKYLPRSERPWHAWPLWLINSGYVWTVRRFVPSGSVVVELGCAGGVRYFGKRYRMVGCDLSLSSLNNLEFYEYGVQSDAMDCIPLSDGSVDAVISSYFWEHIPPEVKPRLLTEASRVLRVGGKLVFLYDVETRNPLIGRYKMKDAALYESLFLSGDHHFGYQLPSDNLSIFRQAGFRVVEHKGLEKTWLQSPSVHAKLARFGTGGGSRLNAWISRMGQRPFFHLYTAFVRLVDTLVCPWLPVDWARIDRVVCVKETG